MPGNKDYQEKIFLAFSLSQRFPENNFYRRLNKVLDIQFVREMAKPYYGREGQKSIDPTVFPADVHGYPENILSLRQLM